MNIQNIVVGIEYSNYLTWAATWQSDELSDNLDTVSCHTILKTPAANFQNILISKYVIVRIFYRFLINAESSEYSDNSHTLSCVNILNILAENCQNIQKVCSISWDIIYPTNKGGELFEYSDY